MYILKKIRHLIKIILTEKQKNILKKIFQLINIFIYRNDLIKLSVICGTDKGCHHKYAKHYQTHFSKFKNKKIKLLEIGVGGYGDWKEGGLSLKMWKAYFSKAIIYSFDIYDKRELSGKRIKIFQGNQSDKKFLSKLSNEIGKLDIIIDDGSHKNKDVIVSFKELFPLLKHGGIYVIEDTQTSYYPGMGGDSNNFNNQNTTMGFVKNLTDSLNHSEFFIPNYRPSYWDKNIISIHFYHNLIFIYKELNNEGSNIIKKGDSNLDWVKGN